MLRERGDMFRDDFNDDNSSKDADKGPRHGHQVTRRGRLGSAVAKPPGDGVREVLPWRRRDDGVDDTIDVEVPSAEAHGVYLGIRKAGQSLIWRLWQQDVVVEEEKREK